MSLTTRPFSIGVFLTAVCLVSSCTTSQSSIEGETPIQAANRDSELVEERPPSQVQSSKDVEERIAIINEEIKAIANQLSRNAREQTSVAERSLRDRISALKTELKSELQNISQISKDKAAELGRSAGKLLQELGESLNDR